MIGLVTEDGAGEMDYSSSVHCTTDNDPQLLIRLSQCYALSS